MSKPTKAEIEKYMLDNDFYTWLCKRAVLPDGEKYSFKGYEYLIEPSKRVWKPGDEVFIEKSAQCGVSEWAIDACLWMAERNLKKFRGMGYIFPAMKQLQDHIKARVVPLVNADGFRHKLGPANLGYIEYNKVPWYFRSGQIRSLKSWPGDFIVIDEFDEYEDPISIVPTIEARLNASIWKWILGLSTPTHPDIGIDKAISLCAQSHWYVDCDCCHKEFSPLTEVMVSGFDNCVVRSPITGKVGFQCPRCKDLTKTTGATGRWRLINETKNQKYSYSISRLFLANTNLEELLEKYEEALNPQEFYNSDLGLPYSPPNSKLKRHHITDMCVGDSEQVSVSNKATWAGVDVGKQCHYVIGTPYENGKKKIIKWGKCTFDQLPNILEMMNVKYMVIDLRPYELKVKEIIRGNRGYWACDFNAGNQTDWYTKIRSDDATSDKTIKVVKADRTQTCDNLILEVASKQKYIYPTSMKADNDYINQMCSVMRIDKVKDKDTQEVVGLYKSTSKKDHYFFASAYLNLAFNLKKGGYAKLGGLFI